jgi:hypothetical protein
MVGKLGGRTRLLPVIVVGAGLAAACIDALLHATAPAGGPRLRFADLVVGISFPLAGAIVMRREEANRAGWLLVATGSITWGPVLNEVAWRVLRPGGATAGLARTGGHAALWIANWIWVPYLLLPTILVLLLPTGHLPSPRWLPVAWVAAAGCAFSALAAMLRPGASDQIPTLTNPLGVVGAGFLGPLQGVAVFLTVGVCGPLSLVALWGRRSSADTKGRAQLQWLASGAIVGVAGFAGSAVAPYPIGEMLLGGGLVAVPASIAVAIWRHQLFDAEVVLNRTIVSSVLLAVGVGLYGAVVVVGGARLGPPGAALLALGAATLWHRLERLSNRVLFGSRDDPYSVVEQLGSRLDTTTAPADALQMLADTVRETLRLPYVAIRPLQGRLAALSSGRAVANSDELDCMVRGRCVGVLAVGHRHPGERWRPDERSVLGEAARRAGALIELSSLLSDLQASRRHVVAAREEEPGSGAICMMVSRRPWQGSPCNSTVSMNRVQMLRAGPSIGSAAI